MAQLEAEVKRLEAEYSLFFSGRQRRLPVERRARVDAAIKKHDRTPRQNTAEPRVRWCRRARHQRQSSG
jgi:hypothetical protein